MRHDDYRDGTDGDGHVVATVDVDAVVVVVVVDDGAGDGCV